MEITEETKIKDLIPEGMELDKIKDTFYKELGDARDLHLLKIDIHLKSIKERDFNWYVDEYCKLHFLVNSGCDYEVRNRKATEFIESFYRQAYNNIPFEIKTGLFRFIFNQIGGGYTFFEHLRNMQEIVRCEFNLNKSILCSMDYELLKICPKEFIKSIF